MYELWEAKIVINDTYEKILSVKRGTSFIHAFVIALTII